MVTFNYTITDEVTVEVSGEGEEAVAKTIQTFFENNL